jgi:hypothetical protein
MISAIEYVELLDPRTMNGGMKFAEAKTQQTICIVW